jgi:hypothetical protein
MPKRKDENETAFDAIQEILRRDAARDGIPQKPLPESAKEPYRVEAGRKGGTKGGKVRAERLSKEKRTKIARKAAKARWSKKKS